jgi:H+/Cl- antiporter ClcA
MARFGSEKIRGHGIPEAIEAILLRGGRVEPKLALLKPLSAAISIGSGGPFGAEGPIIMTGGAFGSMVAQLFHLTSAERRTLLVAGAAAGMSATFAAPLASVLLAVELLLFEWKPRSLVPVALAAAVAAEARRHLLGEGPLFPMPEDARAVGAAVLLGCVAAGLLAGALSFLLTQAVYRAEDAFARLPFHWMWWPALGGLAIGLGGLLFPEALGVGYEVIGRLLQGDHAPRLIAGILLVKSAIWAIALGSGTSGGVLAPLLMMGGALGGLLTPALPASGPGFWPLVCMGAILGGTMRSPFTGIVFSVELTHDLNAALPLLVAAATAHGFTTLVMGRSILTEKIARRGFHVSREYAVDPLEILFVREVMDASFVALPAAARVGELPASIHAGSGRGSQILYPVVEADDRMVGVVTRNDLHALLSRGTDAGRALLRDEMRQHPEVAYADEPLRVLAYRMAQTGLTRFPVVSRDDAERPIGIVSLADLLLARAQNLDAEERRERLVPLPRIFSRPTGARA